MKILDKAELWLLSSQQRNISTLKTFTRNLEIFARNLFSKSLFESRNHFSNLEIFVRISKSLFESRNLSSNPEIFVQIPKSLFERQNPVNLLIFSREVVGIFDSRPDNVIYQKQNMSIFSYLPLPDNIFIGV